MKRILLSILATFFAVTFAMGQTSDRNRMGFFAIPGYPYCHMPNTSETYAIVTDNIVPLTKENAYIGEALNLGCLYLNRVPDPDGADFVISVDNTYFKKSKVDVVDPNKKRQGPRKETKQQSVILEIGRFKWYDTPKQSTSVNNTPQPSAPRKFIAKQTIEMGFTIRVMSQTEDGNGQVVFSDTLSFLEDIESDACPDPQMAKNNLADKTKDYSLKTFMSGYQGFLAKVVGASGTLVNFKMYSVKTKKKCPYDYSDINNACTQFAEPYEFIKKRHSQIDKFKKMAEPSVTAWKNALKEANLTDKTARVNKEIAAAMYYNLAVYSALIKDYQAAYDYFVKADETDLGFDDALAMSKLTMTWIKAEKAYKKRMENDAAAAAANQESK